MSIKKEVKQCMVCRGKNLIYSKYIKHFDGMIDELVEHEGIQCKDCETVHYFEDSKLTFQFYPSVTFGKKSF